jgi:hypothetical protein
MSCDRTIRRLRAGHLMHLWTLGRIGLAADALQDSLARPEKSLFFWLAHDHKWTPQARLSHSGLSIICIIDDRNASCERPGSALSAANSPSMSVRCLPWRNKSLTLGATQNGKGNRFVGKIVWNISFQNR